jgi:hypothetical protein
MKLNSSFVTKDMPDSQIMVAVGSSAFSGIIRSNKTAAFIIDQLKNDTTKEQILDAMLKKYDVEPSVAEADIEKILNTLRSIGALDE